MVVKKVTRETIIEEIKNIREKNRELKDLSKKFGKIIENERNNGREPPENVVKCKEIISKVWEEIPKKFDAHWLKNAVKEDNVEEVSAIFKDIEELVDWYNKNVEEFIQKQKEGGWQFNTCDYFKEG